ncbi:hypothetical protein FHR75_004365 [Kineococcus radiotolerans]|uniref:Uncharacterized protein n=1 Tax=Kineococcus radiotolerans TaxID=131568 RepID=A0A7W4TRR5_KINRA|nr:hypothetical protein [Kineococcus radiotolerans]MBB2903523.1 hypothetical protein [Kineococcus radiotolerans]
MPLARPALHAALLAVAGPTACGADQPAPAATTVTVTASPSEAAPAWTGTYFTGDDRTLAWDVMVLHITGTPVA